MSFRSYDAWLAYTDAIRFGDEYEPEIGEERDDQESVKREDGYMGDDEDEEC